MPMPRIPLAPRLVRFSSAGPIALHPAATGTVVESMTCMGIELAFSPAMPTSAISTGPQVTLSANCAQLRIEFPLASFCCGNEPLSDPKAEANTRRPNEPESTRTPFTVWQFELPGAQTVTLVNTPLAFPPAGPTSTVIACELLEAELEFDFEDPPQDAIVSTAATRATALPNLITRDPRRQFATKERSSGDKTHVPAGF